MELHTQFTPPSDVLPGYEYGWAMCLSLILKLFPNLSAGLQDYLMEPASSSEVTNRINLFDDPLYFPPPCL